VRAHDTFQQQQNSRKARLHAIADERINLQNRLIRSRERLKQLELRHASVTQKLTELQSQPQDFSQEKESLLSKISELENARNQASEKLNVCESAVQETTRALREAESSLGDSRETRAAAQATHQTLHEQRTSLEQSIIEQFNMRPEELPTHASVDADAPKVDMIEPHENLDALKAKKEKLIRERESVGAVNLQADDEAQALQTEVTALVNERNDLSQAIDELRGGINKINKEARERLLAAFETVNNHFQQLFIRLFGGGQAHLALIDAEDPLGAGLEIFAQPPGKTLQSLSLLSGGEQTLASIALIFAMFLTNPSPICVLDEIDAPLDDANVDRVCSLLEDIAKRGETRFLVITHHRLTMARMNRLYGVTMAEKGISQLVSVDLQHSFEFLEAA
jgi:chromosome segregation protein